VFYCIWNRLASDYIIRQTMIATRQLFVIGLHGLLLATLVNMAAGSGASWFGAEHHRRTLFVSAAKLSCRFDQWDSA
jgi:hypothetical protein